MAAFAVYGSLVPFEAGPSAHANLAERIRSVFLTAPQRISRANVLANVLLFVPLGFALMAALLVDRRSRLLAVPAAMVTLAACFALGASVEVLQTFLRDRVPSWIDVAAQMAGCAIGMAIWLAAGQPVTTWLRGDTQRRPGDVTVRVLTLYGVAWAFVNLAPFDLTLDPGHLRQRLDTGLITLVPFGNPAVSGWRLGWDAFATTVSAAPVGALFAVRHPGRRALPAWAAALAVVACLELLQAFIRSHSADTGDFLSAAAGAALGVWAARRSGLAHRGFGVFMEQRAVVLWAALGAWALIVLAYHSMPFDFTVDAAAIERKLSRLSFVPFSGYWRGSYLRALNDLLVKVALAMPLGVIASLALHRRARSGLVTIAAGALCLFTAAEGVQLLIPSRVPEPTDVLIGTSAVVLGAFLTRPFLRDGPARSSELPQQSQPRADAAERPRLEP